MVGAYNEPIPVFMGDFSGSIVAKEFFLAHQISVTGTIMSLYLLERNTICIETRKSDIQSRIQNWLLQYDYFRGLVCTFLSLPATNATKRSLISILTDPSRLTHNKTFLTIQIFTHSSLRLHLHARQVRTSCVPFALCNAHITSQSRLSRRKLLDAWLIGI